MMTIGNDYSQPRLNKCQNGRCFNEKWERMVFFLNYTFFNKL